MEDLKAKIDSAEHVAILLPEHPSREALLAAFALKKSAGAKAFLAGGNATIEKDLTALFEDEAPATRDFALSINTDRFPIEELRYEKQGEKLVVFFTSHSPITKEHFSFEETLPESDLVISVGFPTKRAVEEAIVAHLQSTGAREHIMLSESSAPTLQPKHVPLKLLARILARAREEIALEAFWSFIPSADFEKTNSTPQDVPEMAETIHMLANTPKFLAVLWQHVARESVGGFLYSKNANALSRLSDALGAPKQSDYIFLPEFSSFSEAEIELRKLLKALL